MRPAEGFTRRLEVALFGQGRRQLVADFAQADAGAGQLVVHPQPAAVPAGLPGLGPEVGQGTKSGKGMATALATALSSFILPSTYSISQFSTS